MPKNPFLEWLPDVEADDIVVSPENITVEGRGNQWSFSLTQEQAQSLSVEEVTSFVRAVLATRSRQVLDRGVKPMLFYCWHDEQATQLRFSLVSASHEFLPFGCEIERVDRLEAIITSFLSSTNHDGIPRSELTWIESVSENIPELGSKEYPYALPVWSIRLPIIEGTDADAALKPGHGVDRGDGMRE